MTAAGSRRSLSPTRDLNVRSYIPIASGSSCEDRVFSTVELPLLEVTIPESTFRRTEFRSPQFGICLTTIAIGPSMDQIANYDEISDE